MMSEHKCGTCQHWHTLLIDEPCLSCHPAAERASWEPARVVDAPAEALISRAARIADEATRDRVGRPVDPPAELVAGPLLLPAPAPEGRKDDDAKPRYGLLPWRALRPVVQVLMAGAAHYGDHNWQRVRPFEERYREALLRHVAAYAEGERVDKDSGLPTLAHVACNALFLIAGPGEEAGK